MVIRVLMGIGMLLLGYYVGREVGRLDQIHKELGQTKARKGITIDLKAERVDHPE
ncbi:MAG: hypothetical protein KUF72_00990 [Candidatus Thiodiazotropha sp. (ex Ctena orbiculata)]|nr:hypothetical protein [Candidatus Thiodiazotropha taylori]